LSGDLRRQLHIENPSGLIFDVTVEIPRGSKNKYELDHKTGRIRLDRTLFTSTQYPSDYGFIEGTLGQDGDPLDALVLLPEATFPGALIECRAIAMFRMTDEMGGDDKVMCIPTADTRQDLLRHRRHPRVPAARDPALLHRVQGPEPGKSVEGATWAGRAAAEAEILSSYERAKGTHFEAHHVNLA